MRWRGIRLGWRRFLFVPPLVFVPVFLVSLALIVGLNGYLPWPVVAVLAVAWAGASPATVVLQVQRPATEVLWHPAPVGPGAGGAVCLVRYSRRRASWEVDMLAAEHPGQHAGTWLLQWVCDQADQHERALTLHARTNGLVGYYRRFGFQPHPRRPKRMTRSPNLR